MTPPQSGGGWMNFSLRSLRLCSRASRLCADEFQSLRANNMCIIHLRRAAKRGAGAQGTQREKKWICHSLISAR